MRGEPYYICIMMQMKSLPLAGPPGWGDCCPSLEKLLEPAFFKALCDPSRLAILGRLASMGKACTVSEIAACCPRDISVVSRHLATLKEAGIVSAERRGKEVHYRIQAAQVADFLHRLADALAECCPTEEERKK
jgi:DNA-binding transcriptional ArsR family regulator